MIGRSCRACLSVILLASSPAGVTARIVEQPVPPAQIDKQQVRAVEKLLEAATAYEKGDCARTIKLASPLTDRISAIPEAPELQLVIWEMLARCHVQNSDSAQASVAVRNATALAAAPDELWHLRLNIDGRAKAWDGVVETIEALGRTRPATLNGLSVEYLANLNNELRRVGEKALRVRLLSILASDSFKPTEFMASAESFRRDYAIHLGAAGQKAEAKQVVAKLTHPWPVARISLEPSLRDLFPADPDLRALTEQELARDRKLMTDNPDRLEPVIAVAVGLQLLGKPEEALAVLQSAAARIDDPKAFVDRDKQLPWWWDELSDVYEILGRVDESLEALKKGGALSEGAGPNVSQTINLAHVQVGAGRYKDALATLAAFDKPGHDISPYGQVALREARACAHGLSGDMAAARKDVDYIRSHQVDAPGAIGIVLRCTGDLDGAAAALIARLDDPEHQASALLALSDYDPPVVALPERPMERIDRELTARPDVQAAIKRAGGTRRFNIQDL